MLLKGFQRNRYFKMMTAIGPPLDRDIASAIRSWQWPVWSAPRLHSHSYCAQTFLVSNSASRILVVIA